MQNQATTKSELAQVSRLEAQLDIANRVAAHERTQREVAERERSRLSEELEQVKAELLQERAFCLCDCPLADHERYGEDGLSCEQPDHECLLVCAAAASHAKRQREQLAQARAEIARLGRHAEGVTVDDSPSNGRS